MPKYMSKQIYLFFAHSFCHRDIRIIENQSKTNGLKAVEWTNEVESSFTILPVTKTLTDQWSCYTISAVRIQYSFIKIELSSFSKESAFIV